MNRKRIRYVAAPICGLAAIAILSLCVACSPVVAVPHQAPELEALLPKTVNGQTLERSSIVGHDCIKNIAGIAGIDAATYEAQYTAAGLDLAQLRMASATPDGGLDTVFVVSAPDDKVVRYSFELEVWAAGIRDDKFFAGPSPPLDDRTIDGKSVSVGTPDLMVHQLPGRQPYVHSAAGYFFIIVTAKADWAQEVLQQLP